MSKALKELVEARKLATSGDWSVSRIKGTDWFCVDSDKHSVCHRYTGTDYAIQINNCENNFAFITEAANSIDQIKADWDKMVEVLKFYANDEASPDNGRESHENVSGYWVKYADDWSDPVDRFIKDKGSKARQTLNELGEL